MCPARFGRAHALRVSDVAPTDDLTAVIGAMPEEIEELRATLAEPERVERPGFELWRGRLEGRPVLVALCGIGKVNAAALAQLLILEGAVRLVFTGVAGALDPALRVGDVVIGVDAVQHDVDVTGLGYAPGEVPGDGVAWSADPELVELAAAAAGELEGVRAVRGRIASGDRFVASAELGARLREEFGAACAEMEGAAVAQVCRRAGVPFVIVRSISDTADHAAEVSFREFTPLAAARAREVVLGLLRRLPPPKTG